MKKIFLLILIISTSVFGQKKVGNDIFKMEFLRTMTNLDGSSNDYYTDLVERSMFSKKDSLKYGFLNSKGKEIIGPKYTYASDFYNGKSNIIKDSIPGILLENGKEILFPEYNATYWYKGNLGIAIKEKKYGFIDTSGKIIIDLKYEDAFPFYQGYASVKENGKWNYIDENGTKVFSDSLTFSYRPMIDNKAIFMIDSIKAEKNKSMITENGSRTFVEFLNKTGHIQLKEGLINTNGKIILNPIYDEISGYYQNGYMRVRNNGKTGIIDEQGKIVIPIEYEDISDLKDGLFLAKKSNKYGMINTKEEIVIPFEYSKIRFFNESLALVLLNGKAGYINKENEMIIEPNYKYNFMGDFNNGLAAVRKGDKYGYINNKNEIIIPILYDSALPFKENKAIVKKDGISFIINTKGEEIKNISEPYLWLDRDNLIRFAK
ncbi:WG repeat-containing protein [uncultured Maribacter sp.]|uniref:WG repeat-containing protein n=1 Tax=uncultured Maribacter sp. TaxID=431308 RepID=UPI0030DC96FC|tara:strand:- start:4627 stop:5925 length:1299 start_codon:yes stop_codon:yes gene_type:complete